jgi:hypothetical protein
MSNKWLEIDEKLQLFEETLEIPDAFIEKVWRTKYGLPKLCSYHKGR